MAARVPWPDYARAATPRRKLTADELHTHQRKVAYREGRAGGEAPADSAPQHVRDAWQQGASDKADSEATPETDEETPQETEETESDDSGSSGFRPFSGQDTAQNGAGIVLGVLVYLVAVNYIRGGPDQVRRWFAAKLFNKTTGSGSSAAGPTTPQQQGGTLPKPPPGMGVA